MHIEFHPIVACLNVRTSLFQLLQQSSERMGIHIDEPNAASRRRRGNKISASFDPVRHHRVAPTM